ncbi:MAG: hypothetical protein HKN80_09065 [Acidimicrobiia bacterium]|nr:hypothetical protein [Acidimicrobiia bacterium]
MITGIGSLPHLDPVAAALFVLDTTDVPYLPQLPNRSAEERMLPQWGDGICGCGHSDSELGLAYGAEPRDRAMAFLGADTLLRMLPPDTPALKTQATGPVTMATAMLAAGHPGGDSLVECLQAGLSARIEVHLDAVRRALPETEIILILDEPALSGIGERSFPFDAVEAHGMLDTMMRSLSVWPGIHCCGPADWELAASLDPAWLSWDIDALGPQFDNDREAIAAATYRGTRIMWGVAPAVMGSPPRDLVSRLQRAIGSLVLGGADMISLTSRAAYTTSCGLAGLTEGQAELVARTVQTVVGDLTEIWAT